VGRISGEIEFANLNVLIAFIESWGKFLRKNIRLSKILNKCWKGVFLIYQSVKDSWLKSDSLIKLNCESSSGSPCFNFGNKIK
jgi:hypothetical protein